MLLDQGATPTGCGPCRRLTELSARRAPAHSPVRVRTLGYCVCSAPTLIAVITLRLSFARWTAAQLDVAPRRGRGQRNCLREHIERGKVGRTAANQLEVLRQRAADQVADTAGVAQLRRSSDDLIAARGQAQLCHDSVRAGVEAGVRRLTLDESVGRPIARRAPVSLRTLWAREPSPAPEPPRTDHEVRGSRLEPSSGSVPLPLVAAAVPAARSTTLSTGGCLTYCSALIASTSWCWVSETDGPRPAARRCEAGE